MAAIFRTIAQQAGQTFLSSGTFTVPVGVTEITVIGAGGGGGGSGGCAGTGPGGAGGGGAVPLAVSVQVNPGDVWAVSIGAGGGGGASGGGSGVGGGAGNGSQSTFSLGGQVYRFSGAAGAGQPTSVPIGFGILAQATYPTVPQVISNTLIQTQAFGRNGAYIVNAGASGEQSVTNGIAGSDSFYRAGGAGGPARGGINTWSGGSGGGAGFGAGGAGGDHNAGGPGSTGGVSAGGGGGAGGGSPNGSGGSAGAPGGAGGNGIIIVCW